MNLLTGIISSAGQTLKINSSVGTTSSGIDSTTALTLFGATAGQIQIVVHYVNGVQSAPSTPSNFTSLKSDAPQSNFGYRVSYRIYPSTVSTLTLPTPPSGTLGQTAIGLTISPLSGFTFSGLSVADEVTQSVSASAFIQNQLNANKNDIGLGVLFASSGSNAISSEGGSTMISYGGQANSSTTLYAGADPRQVSGITNLTGSLSFGPCMYLLQVLRPTFS
jgi:hypothetical protein